MIESEGTAVAHRRPTGAAPTPQLLERALFEVKRVVVGQDAMVERMFVAPARPGQCCSRACRVWRRRWRSRTLAEVDRWLVRAPPVHPGPDAG